MTKSPSTPTPCTGDENPGGTNRHGRGFGLSGFATFSAGMVRRGIMRSQHTAHTMGETGRNVGHTAKHEAGGPFSPSHAFNSVIVGGALRGSWIYPISWSLTK
jgi:hypothetical protein